MPASEMFDKVDDTWLASNGNISWPVSFGQAFLLINFTDLDWERLWDETI